MIHDSKHFIKRNLPENGTWCTSSAISIFDRLLSQTPSPHVPRIRRNKAVVGNTLKPQWIEKDGNFLANRWLHYLIKAGHMQDTSFLASQDSSSVRSFIMALPTSEAHQIRMMLFHGRWDQGWKGIIRHQPTHLEFHDSPMFHSVHLKMPRRHCTLRQFQDLAFDKSRSTRSWNHMSKDVTGIAGINKALTKTSSKSPSTQPLFWLYVEDVPPPTAREHLLPAYANPGFA